MNKLNLRSEEQAPYVVRAKVDVDSSYEKDNAHIAKALRLLERRLRTYLQYFANPVEVKAYLTLLLAERKREEFWVMYLTTQHALIDSVCEFTGTVSQTSVYPREIVKSALEKNASAVILAHNHPSGVPSPSRADEYLTAQLKTALALVDVRVVDHIVVGGMSTFSFAEHGLL